MIQAVYFDIGGVIIRTEDLEPRRRWEARFGLPDWGLAKIVFDNPAAQLATVGKAMPEDAWAEAARQLELGPEALAELQADFWKGDVYDHDLLAFIRGLRPNYKTGVISNAWPNAREALKQHINGETFDTLVFSAEEGCQKPDPDIYQRALARLGVAADEAVFVDDMPDNIRGARALGMHGVHFTDRASALAEIRQLLEGHS